MGQDTQGEVWKGAFGDLYVERNANRRQRDLRAFFARALHKTNMEVRSVLEFGAGDGQNMTAIKSLIPRVQCAGVEINAKAHEGLKAIIGDGAICAPALAPEIARLKADLTLTKGFLIHIPPIMLPAMYARLAECSARWVLVAEYFAANPRNMPYRGHEDMLWLRDFAGEMIDLVPDAKLQCIDYGFVWSRDPNPQDNITWFLLEKHSATV
jgi:pseudaminic acid biosynthesis-associated methylase